MPVKSRVNEFEILFSLDKERLVGFFRRMIMEASGADLSFTSELITMAQLSRVHGTGDRGDVDYARYTKRLEVSPFSGRVTIARFVSFECTGYGRPSQSTDLYNLNVSGVDISLDGLTIPEGVREFDDLRAKLDSTGNGALEDATFIGQNRVHDFGIRLKSGAIPTTRTFEYELPL